LSKYNLSKIDDDGLDEFFSTRSEKYIITDHEKAIRTIEMMLDHLAYVLKLLKMDMRYW
jgi:hypothetical protein